MYKNIYIYGCSHSGFFKKFDKIGYHLKLNNIDSMSLSGLVEGKKTKLNIYNKLISSIKANNINYLILKVGQVDIECIYYYKFLIKKELITVELFIENLMLIYSKLIDQILSIYNNDFIIFSINLPSISSNNGLKNYINKIINNNKNIELNIDTNLQKQTEMALLFNKKLNELCIPKNILFIDTTSDFIDPETGLCKKKFQTNKDHHYNGLNENRNFTEAFEIFNQYLDQLVG